MSQSPHILEASSDNFDSVVIENSRRVPVLVDFWAAWCAPCQMLMPMLSKLVQEYQGKFLLAKVNTDEQQELAHRYAIRSLPTVQVFRDGRPVDQFMGVQPESVIRDLLDRHIPRESDRLCEAAAAAEQRGDTAQALQLLQQAHAMEPSSLRVANQLVQLLLRQGDYDGAQSLLQEMPREARNEPEMETLKALVDFAMEAKEAPAQAPPGDALASYRLAAREVLAEDYAEALDRLLEILRTDPQMREKAREAMLAVFKLLGDKSDLVTRYRVRMFNALH
jgi:putative thioredoxin